MKKPLLFSLLVVITLQNYIFLQISPSITTINTLSNYTFLFYRDIDPMTNSIISNVQPVTINSVITILFPATYVNLTNGAYACGSGLQCTMNNRNLTVTGYYATSATLGDTTINITVQGVVNPLRTGSSGEFEYTIQTSAGTVIDRSPQSTSSPAIYNTITLTAGTFASCSFSTSGVVSSKSLITLTATPTNPIPSDGILSFSLPQYWANSFSTDPLISGTLNCSAISTVTNTLTCYYQAPVNNTIITVGNMSGSAIATSFGLSFGSVTLPPTVSPTDTIILYSRLATGEMIDTCTATLTGVTATTLQNITLVSSNTTVSATFTLELNFVNSVLISTSDTIIINVPSTVGMPNVLKVSNFIGYTNVTSGNVITIGNFSASSLAANTNLTITLFSCTNPPNTKPTDNFLIQIQRVGRLIQSGTVGYQSTTGSLTAALNSALFSTNAVTSSQLLITTGSPLAIGSYITLTYTYEPKTPSSPTISQCTVSGVVVTGSSYSLSSQTLTFINVFPNAAVGGILVSLNFTQFTNPPTTQPVTLTIGTFSSDHYSIDTNTLTYTAIPAAISNPTLTSTNGTVLSTANLTMEFTASANFTSVSIITPTDIVVNTDQTSRACTSNQAALTSCTFSSNNLTFLASGAATGITVLTWANTIMPASLSPTGRFQLYTYFNGWLVESFTGLLTLTMNTTAPFTSPQFALSSTVNSATATLTVSFTMPSGSPSGTLQVSIPSPVVFNSGFTCSLNGAITTCGRSGNLVSVSVSNSSLANTLVLSTVTTPPSLEATSQPVVITLFDSNNFSSLLSTLSKIQNTEVAIMTGISLTTGVGFYGQSTNLTILATLNRNQAYVIITLPANFPSMTSTSPCTGCTTPTSNTIRFNTTSASLSLQLTLTSSPQNATNGFTLVSYSSTDQMVQSGTTIVWFPKCASTVCRDCSGSTCVNCYTNNTISLNTILKDGTCTTECPQAGYYLVGVICQPCDSNCAECSKTSKNCTLCNAGTYLDSTTSTCVATCPDEYYKDDSTLTCQPCVSPCKKCTTSAVCLTCITDYFLFGTICTDNCTDGTYIENSQSGKCDPCSTNCLTCENYTFQCASCDTSIPLYLDRNTSTCVIACTGGLVAKDGVCSVCDFPCKTCQIVTTNCTSCDNSSTNPLYYNFTCITGPCPVKYYANLSTASCEQCLDICATCTTSTICTSCITGYYNHNSSRCLTSCPDGTFIFNDQICKACNESCATCSDQNTCLTCTYPLYLNNSICYTACPATTYPNSISTCTGCINNCMTCLNATYCLTCLANFYMYTTQCLSTCPDGTYVNNTDCQACPNGCTTCLNSTQCTVCNTGYSMENSLCVSSCAVGISSNQVCYPCGLNCLSCVYSCTNCTPPCSLCQTDYSLFGLYCVSQCPKTSTQINQICQNCTTLFSTDCLTCNSTNCLTCNKGALIDGKCQDCLDGTFPSLNMCVDCPVECLTCKNNSYCESCVTGRLLYENKCITTCPANMVPEGTGCIQCTPFCSLCNLQFRVCSVCRSSYYVNNGSCVSACPSDLVVSQNGSNCVTPYEFYQEYSQESKVLYFPFTISAVALLCLGLIFKCKFPSLHFFTFATAAVSVIEVAMWAVFLYIELDVFLHGHATGLYGVIFLSAALFFLYTINFVQVCLVNKYFPQDVQYEKWVKKQNHHCSTITMLSVSTCTGYKFFRISYSRLFQKSNFCLDLTSANSLRPIDILTILGTLLTTCPAIVGGAFAMVNSIARDQQYWLSVDCVAVTALGGLLALIDFKRSKDYFSDDFQAMRVKNVYKLQSESQSEVKVQFDEDQQAEVKNLTMGKTFFKSTMANPKDMKFGEDSENDLNLNPLAPNEISHQHIAHEEGSQQNLIDDEEQVAKSADTDYNPASHWVPIVKNTDQFGYLIKKNQQGEEQKYDSNGFKVVIQDGKHVKYDSEGLRVQKNQKGEIMRFDKEGLEVRTGKDGEKEKFDERGYKVTDDKGERKYFNQSGFEIRVKDGQEVIYDADGDIVKANPKTREYEKYDDNGFRIIIGEDGKRTKYDQEGFRVEIDPESGQITKYDSRGYRVVQNESGQKQFLNEDGFKVTVQNGQEVLRDKDGFIIKKIEGQFKKFNDEGFLVVTDQTTGMEKLFDSDGYEVRKENGRNVFYDKHGFRAQKNYYGGITLYDENNCVVQVDEEGNIGKIRPDGLKSLVDKSGKETLWDRRGNQVIFNDEGDYKKINREGRQVPLDDFGYEIAIDEEGKQVKYDLAGDLVQQDDDIIMFEEDNEEGDQAIAPAPIRRRQQRINLKPNKIRQINFDEQINEMMLKQQQKFGIQDESNLAIVRLSQLGDLETKQTKHDKELNKLVVDNRQDFVGNQHPVILGDLKEIKVLPKEHLVQRGDIEDIEIDEEHHQIKPEDLIYNSIEQEIQKSNGNLNSPKKVIKKVKRKVNQQGEESKVSQSGIVEQIIEIDEKLLDDSIPEQVKLQTSQISQVPKKHSKKHKKRIQKQTSPYDPILQHQERQSQVEQPVSVRDAQLSQKTEQNNGVQAPTQKFDDDKQDLSIELDKNILIPSSKKTKKKNYVVDLGGSQLSQGLPDISNNEHQTKTQYRRRDLEDNMRVQSQGKFNTIDLEYSPSKDLTKVDRKLRGVYDPQEEIQSLNGSVEWDTAERVFGNNALVNPPIYNPPRSSAESVVNIRAPVINFIQEQVDNKDTLSDYVDFHIEKEKTIKKPAQRRPPPSIDRSIEVEQQRLFKQAEEPRRLRQFSNTPNPLISYAQTIDNDRYQAKKSKNLEKIYLQQSTDTMRRPKK